MGKIDIQIFDLTGSEIWTSEISEKNNYVVWIGEGVQNGNYVAMMSDRHDVGKRKVERYLIVVAN